MANLVGTGKQFVPQKDPHFAAQGRNGFLALFSEKMNGIFGTLLPANASPSGENGGMSAQSAAIPSDRTEISLFVSSLIAPIERPAPQSLPEDAHLPSITEFLKSILEVLSNGDEIELKGHVKTAGTGPSNNEVRQDGPENAAEDPSIGSCAIFLAALNKMAGRDVDTGLTAAGGDVPHGCKIEEVLYRQPQTKSMPDTVRCAAPGNGIALAAQDAARAEAPERRVAILDVTYAAKGNGIIDISMNDLQKRFESVSTESKTGAMQIPPDRRDAVIENTIDPDMIIIRVTEKEKPALKNGTGDRPENESGIGLNGNSLRNGEQNTAQMQHAEKTNFGAMMMDKIEKIAERCSGKNPGMDMTVRLKIDDNETILVGLRDEGARVAVEVKTARENTMNFIQSQKDDLTRNLEERHVMTTIHVDIDQDAQKRHRHGRDQGNDQAGAEDDPDFGSFFQAIA